GLLDICPMAGLCGDQLAARGFIWLNATPDRISAPATAMLGVSASSSRSHAHNTPNNTALAHDVIGMAWRGHVAMANGATSTLALINVADATALAGRPARY